jgi:hypothetical protein
MDHFVPGPAGRLAAKLWTPPDGSAPRAAAVVCHPHPLHGGTMDNKVAYRIARALEDCGGLVLRFNFRGAGRSEGAHDAGRGEQDDLRAALAHLRQSGGAGLPALLAGFSFGAAMAAAVGCADPSVEALLLVGLPVLHHDFGLLRRCARPVAIVQGDRDEHGTLPEVRALHDSIPGPRALRVIEGANHFFDGRQDQLSEAVRDLVTSGALGLGVVQPA